MKNTTKYGPNAKIPIKRAKKQDKEPANPTVQSEQAIVQDENATIQYVQAKNDNAIVSFVPENLIIVTSPTKPTKEIILQESPIRLTRG